MYATHHLVDQIAVAKKLTHKLFVRVCQIILEHRLGVTQNVSQVQNAHGTKLVSTKSAKIPVLIHVVLILNVELSIIVQFVSARFNIQEIHLQDVTQIHVSFYNLT